MKIYILFKVRGDMILMGAFAKLTHAKREVEALTKGAIAREWEDMPMVTECTANFTNGTDELWLIIEQEVR